MTRKDDLMDRVCGCIFGGAVGDAMGVPFEGQPGPIEYSLSQPWAISDDTQLTLATCQVVGELGEVRPEQIAARFVAWFRDGKIIGVGASTLKALCDLHAGAHWALAGAKGEKAAGAGAAMRVAPLAFLLDPANDEDRQTLRDVCRITHHHDEAYIGALAVVLAVRMAAFDEPSLDRRWLARVAEQLPDSRVRDQVNEIANVPAQTAVFEVGRRFGCSGFVAETVPLALYAARQIEQFPLLEVLQNAITAGGDTDTIASIAGQVAGARVGMSAFPGKTLESLPDFEAIMAISKQFSQRVLGIR